MIGSFKLSNPILHCLFSGRLLRGHPLDIGGQVFLLLLNDGKCLGPCLLLVDDLLRLLRHLRLKLVIQEC